MTDPKITTINLFFERIIKIKIIALHVFVIANTTLPLTLAIAPSSLWNHDRCNFPINSNSFEWKKKKKTFLYGKKISTKRNFYYSRCDLIPPRHRGSRNQLLPNAKWARGGFISNERELLNNKPAIDLYLRERLASLFLFFFFFIHLHYSNLYTL